MTSTDLTPVWEEADRPPSNPHSDVVAALLRDAGGVAPAVVEQCVASEAARFEDARIRAFVPLLVYKTARERLRPARPPG